MNDHWKSLLEVKKGDIGEDIIIDYLNKKGFAVYAPSYSKPHWIDIFATRNKNELYAIDVKTKARFNKWNAQGFDYNDYESYKRLQNLYKLKVFIFFIDDKNGNIHCADLNKLSEGFRIKNIIAWNLSEMKLIHTLSQKQIQQLTKYDNRTHDYKPK